MLEKILRAKNTIFLILIFTTIIRLWGLNYPNAYVFDEVYHAFTAKEYLKGSKEAWEWWTTTPPGVAYEWTHPPLAKEIMAASMFITQTTDAWAWRLPGVLLGILSVYLVYLLGMKLLKKQTASLFAAFAFSIDGLNLVQSRTGMNDIYFLTFMLGSLLFLVKKKYLFSSIFLGLSLSSKWAGLYTYLIIIPLLLKDRQYLKILFFLSLPTLIYLLTYIPFFLLGHNINHFVSLQQQMWWYHTGLKAIHDYASAWWSWPLNLYPVWYFVDYLDNRIANIFASGNTALFWTATVALVLTIWETFKKKSINLFLIILGFFVFWLPWAISPRIMFLYHFAPSVPFLTLALGHQLSSFFSDKKTHKLAIFLVILMAINFILIYPFLVGIPILKDFVNFFFLTNLSKNPF